jgi:hypothetical protein
MNYPVDPDQSLLEVYDSTSASPLGTLTGPDLRKNRWVRICIVREVYFDGSSFFNIIVNNSSSGSFVTPATNYSFTQDLVIGNDSNFVSSNSFAGQIYNFTWLLNQAIFLTPFFDIPINPQDYALVLMGNYSAGTESGTVLKFNITESSNTPAPPLPPTPPLPPPAPQPIDYSQRLQRNSFGQFWFGKSIGFPGFLYKKNVGVGGRRSTKMAPGGNATCNTQNYLYNKYKPGTGGVGASSIAVRRAKNRLSTVCSTNNCFPCYMTLGQYNKNYNPNGFYPCIVNQKVLFLESKNNITPDGFPVGDSVNKDMQNDRLFDFRFTPSIYPNYFPGMTPPTFGNIYQGNKPLLLTYNASFFQDWGNDIFDDWGFFYLYDFELGGYFFPLFSEINQADGLLYTQVFEVFGRTFTINQGYPVEGIFKIDISVNDSKPFRFGMYGDMGSDSNPAVEYLSYAYSLSSVDLTLYYLKQAEINNPAEILYSYFIPKKVAENTNKTYDFYQDIGTPDDVSLMSKPVTNGLILYLAKNIDVKEWIVNDLKIN